MENISSSEYAIDGNLSRFVWMPGIISKGKKMSSRSHTLTVIIPCYNEEQTLEECVSRVFAIQKHALQLEIIIVDDCSTDGSASIAQCLAANQPQIVYFRHERNMG
jgi:cellulose synthase/poly-beta-1,6-N-acetylglucosamine synthase-like glycosyltransferase